MDSPRRTLLYLLAVGLFLATPGSPATTLSRAAGPPSDVHADYAAVLSAHVDDRGRVDYRALSKDRSKLDGYLRRLATLDLTDAESWQAGDRIALYINAYNAFTLTAIIDHYPIKAGLLASLWFPKNSIRQIDGVWDALRWTLAGENVTLDEIEHEILRKRFGEPRIHMALVCAAKGCPPLRNEPYSGAKVFAQLEDQTRRFLSDPSKFRIDRASRTVYLSPIFKWYGSDFTKVYGRGGPKDFDEPEKAVLDFIAKHLERTDSDYLQSGDYAISYLDYDWSLNER